MLAFNSPSSPWNPQCNFRMFKMVTLFTCVWGSMGQCKLLMDILHFFFTELWCLQLLQLPSPSNSMMMLTQVLRTTRFWTEKWMSATEKGKKEMLRKFLESARSNRHNTEVMLESEAYKCNSKATNGILHISNKVEHYLQQNVINCHENHGTGMFTYYV